MISVGIFGRRATACLLAAGLLAAPTLCRADGVMLVQAGAFWMGRNDGAPEEAPLHRVYVRDFWIDRERVTNAEFAEFLNATGLRPPGTETRYDVNGSAARIHRSGERWIADPGFERRPVIDVSWFGARDYCAWKGRRLPTEAEWEKAARGNDRRPVGASPYGVQDILGDLREWTSTALRPYPYRADDGREPYAGATGRVVVRGASHDDPGESPGVTRRHSYDRRGASAGHDHIGFRCATSEDLGEMAPGGGSR
jgi:formylglycine-generating enzyme required for sulfatase activity